MKTILIKADEAIKALPVRGPIHCFAGFIGADWDKASIRRELRLANRIAWVDHPMKHNLAIEAGPQSPWFGRSILYFDVRQPEPELRQGS